MAVAAVDHHHIKAALSAPACRVGKVLYYLPDFLTAQICRQIIGPEIELYGGCSPVSVNSVSQRDHPMNNIGIRQVDYKPVGGSYCHLDFAPAPARAPSGL